MKMNFSLFTLSLYIISCKGSLFGQENSTIIDLIQVSANALNYGME
jgi:hypothetical protein